MGPLEIFSGNCQIFKVRLTAPPIQCVVPPFISQTGQGAGAAGGGNKHLHCLASNMVHGSTGYQDSWIWNIFFYHHPTSSINYVSTSSSWHYRTDCSGSGRCERGWSWWVHGSTKWHSCRQGKIHLFAGFTWKYLKQCTVLNDPDITQPLHF